MTEDHRQKCLVKGCENHTDEGEFFHGILCMPCHQMLTTGKVGDGLTFIHKLRDIIHIVSIRFQHLVDLSKNYRDYLGIVREKLDGDISDESF